jgi:hypothetical protein
VRRAKLYAPPAVCAAWATAAEVVDEAAVVTVVFAALLAVALVLHISAMGTLMNAGSRARDNHPGDRSSDDGPKHPNVWDRCRRVWRWLRRYVLPATLWSFLASGLAVWALVLGHENQQHVIAQQSQIQQGRKTAVLATCAIASAIGEAGRATIGNPMPLPPGVEALLDAHGFPLFPVRKRQAQAAARAYVKGISASVETHLGHRGDHLVRPDGSLDCAVLAQLAHTHPTGTK